MSEPEPKSAVPVPDVVFDWDDWGNFWNNEGGLPSDLMHGRTVQFEGRVSDIWRNPYAAIYCAFCFTNKVDFTRFTAFCASCFRMLTYDKDQHFTELRSKKRLRKPQKARKTRSRAVADDSTETL